VVSVTDVIGVTDMADKSALVASGVVELNKLLPSHTFFCSAPSFSNPSFNPPPPSPPQGLDIGPDSIKTFSDALKTCKTVVWNGPMGVFEFDKFAKGTMVSCAWQHSHGPGFV
jgi:hypothetical protein